jgi:hypothetical protein
VAEKSGAVPFVTEPPNRAVLYRLEPLVATHRDRLGEIGNRVEAGDRKTGEAVHHHPLGRRLAEGLARHEERNQQRKHVPASGAFPFLPP